MEGGRRNEGGREGGRGRGKGRQGGGEKRREGGREEGRKNICKVFPITLSHTPIQALPFLHTLISSSSLTLPSSSLDTLFLHRLLLPHPHLALASAVFLWKVYFPLRW